MLADPKQASNLVTITQFQLGSFIRCGLSHLVHRRQWFHMAQGGL